MEAGFNTASMDQKTGFLKPLGSVSHMNGTV